MRNIYIHSHISRMKTSSALSSLNLVRVVHVAALYIHSYIMQDEDFLCSTHPIFKFVWIVHVAALLGCYLESEKFFMVHVGALYIHSYITLDEDFLCSTHSLDWCGQFMSQHYQGVIYSLKSFSFFSNSSKTFYFLNGKTFC